MSETHAPPVSTSHTLHLTARGAGEASAWYQQAFAAEELSRLAVPGDRLIHVELRIADLRVMLADEFPEMGSFGPQHFGGTYGAVYLHVDDVDTAWQRAVDAGASVVRPVNDAYWGEREGHLRRSSAVRARRSRGGRPPGECN